MDNCCEKHNTPIFITFGGRHLQDFHHHLKVNEIHDLWWTCKCPAKL
jgi:hypothetical protein